ncbi:MAG: hypothetical protein NC087_04520 [Anaeroplasma bactoclasticum]|nr:hypothetical protein [Anaeroplasma bactoclasticum]
MKKISMHTINKIKECKCRIYEAEDCEREFVDRRAVASNERAIEHWLDKEGIFDKDLRMEVLDNVNWADDNCAGMLEKLGWTIVREVNKRDEKEN